MGVDLAPGVILRRARPDDHAAMCGVCLKTGASGADATTTEDDPALLGLYYAVPYQVLEPDFAFVVEDAIGVGGYVLATPDTQIFYHRLTAEWLPALRQRSPDPGRQARFWGGSDWLRHRIHQPMGPLSAAFNPFPAQAHIDLLPRLQGHGIGRRAFGRVLGLLAKARVPGLHLHVSPLNPRAQQFYRALGFQVVTADDLPNHTTFMVRSLADWPVDPSETAS